MLNVKSIVRLEIRGSVENMGYRAKSKTIYQLIMDLDADGTGTLGFTDFLYLMSSKARTNNISTAEREEISRIFALFDDDKTGYLTETSLRRFLR